MWYDASSKSIFDIPELFVELAGGGSFTNYGENAIKLLVINRAPGAWSAGERFTRRRF